MKIFICQPFPYEDASTIIEEIEGRFKTNVQNITPKVVELYPYKLASLGILIQNLEYADLVVFAPGWREDWRCRVIESIVNESGLNHVYMETV